LEKRAESPQQALVPLGRDGADYSKQMVGRKYGDESKADEGRSLESTATKV